MRETSRENETNRETQSEREAKMAWCRPGLWDRPLGHTTFLLLFERNKYILSTNQFLGASVFYLIQFHSFIPQGDLRLRGCAHTDARFVKFTDEISFLAICE